MTKLAEAKKAFDISPSLLTARLYFLHAVEFDRFSAFFDDPSRDERYNAALADLVAYATSIGEGFSVEWLDYERCYAAIFPSFMDISKDRFDSCDREEKWEDNWHESVDQAVSYIRDIFGDVDIKIIPEIAEKPSSSI